MTQPSPVARRLAALGHDARLSIYRLLVRAGDDGLIVGEIGARMSLAPSTLARSFLSGVLFQAWVAA